MTVLQSSPAGTAKAHWRLGLLTFFFLILSASTASALPEICGNGFDDDGVDGDALCPDPDKDNDGYASNVDCDDTNYKVFPGVVTTGGCGAGETHKCQSNGTFTACSATPVCEATGTGTCKYIDCTSGNDAGDGSFGSPWRSPKKVGSFEDASLRPAGWYDLKAGDVVYFKGSGACSATYNPGAGRPNVMMFTSRSGNSTYPITFKRYPGSTVVLDPPFAQGSQGHVFMVDASNIRIEDLDLTGSYGAVIYLTEASNIEVSRVRCHDTQGTTNDNVACINAAVPTNHYIHHNEFSNVYDPAVQGAENVSLIVYFKGGANRFEYNRLFYTADPNTAPTVAGRCFKYKHPSTSAGDIVLKGNQFWNCNQMAVGNSTSTIRMDHNLIVNTGSGGNGPGCAYFCGDLGGGAKCSDVVIENNTILNSQAVCMRESGPSLLGAMTFRNNVVTDNDNGYGSENGFYRIERYGNGVLYALFASLNVIRASNNCYFNPNTALQFDYFADGGVGGGMLSFSQWQARGFDSGSYNEDPGFNSVFAATSAHCASRGWTSGSSGGTARPSAPTGLSATVVGGS